MQAIGLKPSLPAPQATSRLPTRAAANAPNCATLRRHFYNVGRRFGERYWQPGNLNDAIRVLQLNVPLAFKYSVVYQKVQSSTGSTVIAL